MSQPSQDLHVPSSDTPAPASAPPLDQGPHPWRRYVALGDSFTEGIGDPDARHPGYHRGWADRVAQELARQVPTTDHTTSAQLQFAYANLAVRGKLIDQIAADQADPAVALSPDLISLCAGGNDVIRPGGDPDRTAEKLDELVGRLAATGATIVLFNGPDIRDTPVVGKIRGKVAIFNENVRVVARRHDTLVADMWALRELTRPEMWDPDRLHFSPIGHHTIARMVLDTLNVPHTLDPAEAAPAEPRTWRQARAEDARWAREHLGPWVLRRLRGQSSGDGRSAKRPDAGPVGEPVEANFGQSMPHGADPAEG